MVIYRVPVHLYRYRQPASSEKFRTQGHDKRDTYTFHIIHLRFCVGLVRTGRRRSFIADCQHIYYNTNSDATDVTLHRQKLTLPVFH